MLILILISQYALAQEKPQAMIVFDASGSMWGQIDGEAKITVAKKALNKVVSNWDTNVDLGLIAYGHRKKGDCSDIQTLVPIGQVDKKGMISKVQKIKPKGKTPISQSIKKAAEALKYTEEKATVILISDGKETCNADPCATAKALENEGIDFIAHVIGFNVDKQTDKQLKCIADVTGGEYFSAKNASSLNEAIGKIAEKVQKVQKVEPPKPVIKKLKYNLEITASESEGSKWVEAYHLIYPMIDGEKQDRIETCSSYKKKSCLEQLPVGKYSLHSTYKDFKKDTPFEIKSGETTRLSVIFTQFIIDAKCADMSAKISYEVYASNGQMIFDKKAICSDKVQLSIDNGDYTLEASVGSNTKSKKFTIGSGHPNTLTIDMLATPAAKAKEDSHEDLIKADSPSEPQSNSKPTSAPASSKEKTSKISGIPITTEKTPDKMLEAFKQSIIVSLPMIKQTQQCYQQADNLDQAKNCENLEEKAMLKAQAVIKKIAGVKTQPKPLSKHSEWNNQIKTSTLAGTAKDIIKMKLSIICIDKVNSFSQLATCIANNTK